MSFNKFIFSPSLAACKDYNYSSLIDKLLKVNIKAIHFDVMDGSLTKMIGLNPEMILSIPTNIFVDIHIMSKSALEIVKNIPFRNNTCIHTHFRMIKNFSRFIKLVNELGFIVGITLDLSDDLSQLKDFIYKCDFINFMSVNQIGSSNQIFQESVYQKIKSFKKLYPNKNFKISIDGSVRESHLKKLTYLVDYVVLGSLLYNASDFEKQLEFLENK